MGRRCPRARQPEKPCPGRLASAARPHEKHRPRTGRPRKGGRTGAARRPRSPRPPQSRRHPGEPRCQQGGDWQRAERGKDGGVSVRVGTSWVGRPRGEEETRLLELGRDRRELRDCGADHIANRVVAQHPVTTAAAGEGVVSSSTSPHILQAES